MHELGIVYEVIKIVDQFVIENQLMKVEKIVLEIGELSQAIPRFIEECFPAAVADTPYEATALEIVTIPAVAVCKSCHTEYGLITNRKICPSCLSEDFTLVSGREFSIKEIAAY